VQLFTFQKPSGDAEALLSDIRAIPGALVRGNLIKVPADLARVVYADALAMGFPLGEPVIRGQIQRAVRDVRDVRGYDKFWPFQKELALYGAGQADPWHYVPPSDWVNKLQRDVRMLWAPCGCLTGETELVVNRGGNARRMKLKDLVYKFNGGKSYGGRKNADAAALGGKGKGYTWRADTATRTQSMDDNGTLRLNTIVAAVESGRKPVFKIALDNGKTLRATEEHLFLTPDGWRKLSELAAGSFVMADVGQAKGEPPKKKPTYTHWQGLDAHPFAKKYTLHRKPPRGNEEIASVAAHRLVIEAEMNGLLVGTYLRKLRAGETAGLKFLSPTVHVHHKDGDTKNFALPNLEVLSGEEHLRQHGLEGGFRHVNYKAAPVRVASVVYDGLAETYDLTMTDPLNNYVANGMVVHNSGKSSMGLVIASAAATDRAPTLIVTKAGGRESYLRDAAWAGNFKKVGLLLGRYPASDETRAAARGVDKKFVQRFRDRGTNCRVYVDADEAIAEGCDCLVIAWETIATSREEVYLDDTGKERKRKLVDLRKDLRRAWGVILYDEIHFAANRSSMRGDVASRMSETAAFVFGMTASSVRAGIQDLWAQLSLVAPGAWGRKSWDYLFRYLHATRGEFGGLVLGDPRQHFPRRGSSSWPCSICQRASAELAARVGHYVEIRDLSVVRSQLPAKRREFHRLPWPEKYRKSKAPREEGSSYERALGIAADIATPWAVERAVELLTSGAKIVVVGQRLSWVGPTMQAIRDALPKAVEERLWMRGSFEDGNTLTPVQRAAMADEYMIAVGPACIVGTISALGESIDLQDTDEAILVTLPQTVAAVTQIEGRFQRIGQKRPVTISYCIPEGTISEVTYDRLLAKMTTVDAIGAATDDTPWQAEAAKTDEQVQTGVREWLRSQAAAESGEEAA
jgi:hypothetical protein